MAGNGKRERRDKDEWVRKMVETECVVHNHWGILNFLFPYNHPFHSSSLQVPLYASQAALGR